MNESALSGAALRSWEFSHGRTMLWVEIGSATNLSEKSSSLRSEELRGVKSSGKWNALSRERLLEEESCVERRALRRMLPREGSFQKTSSGERRDPEVLILVSSAQSTPHQRS
jgi:hypothetical protein